jgi:hypothetical protein
MEERDAHTSDPHLSRAYREADHPEPSAHLDARILDAARQAVARSPVRKPGRWFTWALPLSTTAVLLLGLTLLLEMQQQAPEVLESPMGAHPTDPTDMADGAPAPQPAEPTVGPRRPAETSDDRALPAEDRAERAWGSSAEMSTEAGGMVDADRQNLEAIPPEPQPFPTQSRAPAAPAAAKSEVRSIPQAATAPALEDATPFSQNLGKHKAASPVQQGPEQWLETIRQLLREGRQDEARQELEKLRKAYPAFTLPEDLKNL